MDYVRYLKSKESIDDRALNCQVLEAFENYVSSASHDYEDSDTLRVLEVGAGVGSMFLRLYQRGSLFSGFQSVNYTLVDVKDEVLQAASERIRSISTLEQTRAEVYEGAMQSRLASISGDGSIHYAGSGSKPLVVFDVIEVSKDFKVTLVLSDAFRLLDEKRYSFDVVIGAAVLDLWDLEFSLTKFLTALDPKGHLKAFYFPINFDGTTDFFPGTSEGQFDAQVEDMFHSAMGVRKNGETSYLACHTGRRLLPMLRKLNADVRRCGSSSWVVYPKADSRYNADEAYFLKCILMFIEYSLCDTATPHSEDDRAMQRYLEYRERQLEDGELYYTAHNLDAFGTI